MYSRCELRRPLVAVLRVGRALVAEMDEELEELAPHENALSAAIGGTPVLLRASNRLLHTCLESQDEESDCVLNADDTV